MRRAALLAALAALAGAPAAGRAAPAVVPGWPVPAPAGAVFPGPSAHEVVVIGSAGQERIVAAYGSDERRRWLSRREPVCGNCDDGDQVERLQPDDTYGPIGIEGDDYWAVDGQGRFVLGCPGAVLPDATCIVAAGTKLAARRAGVVLWEHPEPRLALEEGVPPLVVADRRGTVYTSYPGGTVYPTGAAYPAALLAFDAATGAPRWMWNPLEGAPPFTLLTGLDEGVLIDTRREIVAFGSDGSQRWRSDLFSADYNPSHVLLDAARNRLYVGTRNPATPVTAFDPQTGRVVWRTAPPDRATLLSVGASGIVYIAVERDGATSLRAIAPDGRVRWEHPTVAPVVGASELRDETVALTTRGIHDRPGALLTRIDPGRAAPEIRRASFSLSRAKVRTRCDPVLCDLVPAAGTILRLDLRRSAHVRVRILSGPGGPAPALRHVPLDIAAPAGTSFVRLLAGENLLRAGRYRVEVSLLDGAPRVVRRFPIVTR